MQTPSPAPRRNRGKNSEAAGQPSAQNVSSPGSSCDNDYRWLYVNAPAWADFYGRCLAAGYIVSAWNADGGQLTAVCIADHGIKQCLIYVRDGVVLDWWIMLQRNSLIAHKGLVKGYWNVTGKADEVLSLPEPQFLTPNLARGDWKKAAP